MYLQRFLILSGSILCLCTSSPAQTLSQDTARANVLLKAIPMTITNERFDEADQQIADAMAIFKKYSLWEDYLKVKYLKAHLHNKKYYTHGEQELIRSEQIANEVIAESQQKLGIGNIVEADAWATVGWKYEYMGFSEKALSYFQKEYTIKSKLLPKDTLPMGVVHYNLASIARSIGNPADALLNFQKAADIFDIFARKDNPRAIFNYVNASLMLALVHNDNNAPAEALPYALCALRVAEAKSAENRSRMAFIHESLGKIYEKLGEDKSALHHYKKAVSICEEKADANRPILARIFTQIADYYHAHKKTDQAIEYIQKAHDAYNSTKGDYVKERVRMLSRLGDFALASNQWQAAQQYYQQAQDLYTTSFGAAPYARIADNYYTIANALYQRGEYRQAIQQLTLAASYNRAPLAVQQQQVAVLSHDATLAANPDHQQYLSPALGLSIGTLYAECLYAMALPANDLALLERGATGMKGALQLINNLKRQYAVPEDKTRLLQKFRAAYRVALQIYYALYQRTQSPLHLEAAFQIAESNKSTLLLEMIQTNRAQTAAGIPDSLSAQEQDIKQRIAHYEKKLLDAQQAKEKAKITLYQTLLFDLQSQYKRLLQHLENSYTTYYQSHYTDTTTRLADLQALLPPHSLCLEYFVADSTIYTFSITRHHATITALVCSDLEQQVGDFRQWLTGTKAAMKEPDQGLGIYQQFAYRLYQQLVAPVLRRDSLQQLLIIPDGVISFLPFEALVSAPQTAGGYAQLPYLLHQYAVQYAFSAGLLLEQSKTKTLVATTTPQNQLLAFAASYSAQSDSSATRDIQLKRLRSVLQDLPAAQQEVQRLESFLAGHFFYRTQASEAQFKKQAPYFQVIHLAMHGYLDEKNPMSSALVFSENRDSIEDNVLYAYELSNMKLAAQMVVLSACETGYGKFQYGEGVMSIARSFVYAGVPSLVMSLWQVNDQSTAWIMEAFYKELTQGSSKSQALRQAKLQYLQQAKGIEAHPALWAPFVVTGNDTPLALQSRTNGLFGWGGAAILLGGIALISLMRLRRKR